MTEPTHISPLTAEEIDRANRISRKLVKILVKDLRANPSVPLVAMAHAAIEVAILMTQQGYRVDVLRQALRLIPDRFDYWRGERPTSPRPPIH